MKSFPFKKRVKSVIARLKESAPAALLLTSASVKYRNRDTSYPYRQDSDFFYLTGITDPGYALLISSDLKRPCLLGLPTDPAAVLWNGPTAPLNQLAEKIGAEPITTKDLRAEIKNKLRGIEQLFFQNTPETLGWEIASDLMRLPSFRRTNLPARFTHCDEMLAEMRLYKDRSEIEAIVLAGRITTSALYGALSGISAGTSELEIAAIINFHFQTCGATAAFAPIVASGSSAATLHHKDLTGTLHDGDLLLLDVGAEHEMYAGDITRVIPVSGRFDPIQRELYEIVLNSQKAAIKKVRAGYTLLDVHNAAAEVITDGLVTIKALKGNRSKLLATNAYKKFFPHSIGHMLGMDVHDITKGHPANSIELKPGMVLTIEPGLYFQKRLGKIPACGIRIEDDVLVTAKAPVILSEGFPKEIADVEGLFE